MLTRTIKGEKNSPLARSSLSQTRLNAIVEGTVQFSLATTTWISRIRHAPQVFTKEALEERAEELVPQIEALDQLVTRPPSTMDPEEWLNQRERLAKLRGQARAIRLILEDRSAYRSCSATPAQPLQDWGLGPGVPDPFSME